MTFRAFMRLAAVTTMFVLASLAPDAHARWERSFGTAVDGNASSAHGVKFLSDGSTVVVGLFQGEFEGLIAVDGWDFFMVRLDIEGEVVWVRSWDSDQEYDQPPDSNFVFTVDGDDRAYLVTQGEVESGIWVVQEDGTVAGAPLANSSDPAGRYPEAIFARRSGVVLLERVDSPDPDAPYSLTFRDESLVTESTRPLGLGQPDFGVFQGGEGWGTDLLIIRSPETTALFPEQGLDLAVTRIADDGSERWSTQLGDSVSRVRYSGVLLRAKEVLVTTEISDSYGVTSFDADTGRLQNLAVADSGSGSLLVTPTTCAALNEASHIAGAANCDQSITFRRDYWSTYFLGSHVASLRDGRLATIGLLDRGNNGVSDSVAILESTGSELLGLVRSTLVIENPSAASMLIAVAADATSGRVVAVGREGSPGDSASVLVVSNPWGHGFADVPLTGWQSEPVEWLRTTRLTTGCSEAEFCPDDQMPREQLVTFLYRYNGEPVPGDQTPFQDVEACRYYSNAISWAYNAGVTTGVSAGLFGVGEVVTRGQAVTFLWRDLGEPKAAVPADFPDVPGGKFYSDAVAWAAESGVTTGFPDGTFRPEDPVTRAQFAAFFQRYDSVT